MHAADISLRPLADVFFVIRPSWPRQSGRIRRLVRTHGYIFTIHHNVRPSKHTHAGTHAHTHSLRPHSNLSNCKMLEHSAQKLAVVPTRAHIRSVFAHPLSNNNNCSVGKQVTSALASQRRRRLLRPPCAVRICRRMCRMCEVCVCALNVT